MGTPYSAKVGSASFAGNVVDDVRNIALNKEQAEKPFASSSTNCKMRRVLGHSDQTGSFDVYVDKTIVGPTGIPGFDEGDEGELILKGDADQVLFQDNVVIISVDIAAPIEGGDIVEATVNWGRNPTS